MLMFDACVLARAANVGAYATADSLIACRQRSNQNSPGLAVLSSL